MPTALYKLRALPWPFPRPPLGAPIRYATLCAFGAFWIIAPVHALASDQGPSLGVEAPVILVDNHIDRRVELKRMLLTTGDLPSGNSRRELSRDERDALSRELREAISGLYEQRAEERARNRAGR